MTQKEKQLLLKDLCARLPYGVKVDVNFYYATKELSYDLLQDFITDEKSIRPYLRPMSSITFDECFEIEHVRDKYENHYDVILEEIDWLNKKMFDYRGLIPMGLALEAKEGMYEMNNE